MSPDRFTGELYQTSFAETVPGNWRGENSFQLIIWNHYSDTKTKQRCKKTTVKYLMNIDVKILHKFLVNRIPNIWKRQCIISRVGFIPGKQCWLNIQKWINIIHHINKLKRKNRIISIYEKKNLTKSNIHSW